MNRIFKVYLAKADSPSEASAELDLPSGPHALLDALDKARLGPEDKLYMEILEYYECEYLMPFLNSQCDVYALNALAGHLSDLEGEKLTAFEGLLQMEVNKREGPITMQKLCDLAVSADRCHVVGEALNDSQLGRFYAENSFVPEVEDLPDAVFELLDFEKIGRQARLDESGVFTESGYVIQSGEPRQAPPVPTGPPPKPDYEIQVRIGSAQLLTGVPSTLELTADLPLTVGQLTDVFDRMSMEDADSAQIQIMDSTLVEQIGEVLPYRSLPGLNELADVIQQIDASGQLPKYKAMLEARKCTDLDAAILLADKLDEYIFDPNISSFTELAEDELNAVLSSDSMEPLKKHLNLYGYGRDLLETSGAALTSYGFLQRDDGQPIQAMTEQPCQGGMEMKME